MDRQTLSALAHADHPVAAPLSEQTVRGLLRRAIRKPDGHVLDLGCGSGAWLSRALDAHPERVASAAWRNVRLLVAGCRERLSVRECR